MKSFLNHGVFPLAGLFALFFSAAALLPSRAAAGGLEIGLNVEVAPPPQTETVVVEHGAPVQEVVVQAQPPPLQKEIIIERPSPQHVWIAGYWHWQGDRYVWVRGHWMLAPQADVEWVAPHVEHREVFIPGHWRHLPPPPTPVAVVVPAPAPVVSGELSMPGLSFDVSLRAPVTVVEVAPPQYETVVVEQAAPPVEVVVVSDPPPVREEVIIERPSPRHVWIGGYWHWQDNRYGWVRGHWMLPPSEDVVWVAPRIEHRGNNRVFVAGSWRRGSGPGPHQASASAPMHAVPPAAAGPVRPVVAEHPVANGPAHPIVEHPVANEHPPMPAGHGLGIHEAPPPLRHEGITGPRPSPSHIWIPGYWRHDGHAYVWAAGHWGKPPQNGHAWVPARWESHEGGWVFIEGRWE